jgi:hypothetical protein
VETKEINVLELYVYFKFRLANKIVKNARANWNSILISILLNLLSSQSIGIEMSCLLLLFDDFFSLLSLLKKNRASQIFWDPIQKRALSRFMHLEAVYLEALQ